ncbi:hypothetical protein ACVRYP_01210 [Streptococcus rifensis]
MFPSFVRAVKDDEISELQATQQWLIGAKAPNDLCRGNTKTGKASECYSQPLRLV